MSVPCAGRLRDVVSRRRPNLLVLSVLLVMLTGACGLAAPSGPADSPVTSSTGAPSSTMAPTTAVSTTAVPTTAVPTTALPTTAGTTVGSGSVLGQLSTFVAQARSVDAALRALSSRVNAGIDSQQIRIDKADVAALRAITPHRLVATVPGGLPAPVLRASLLVYADLVSRRDAFNRWDEFASESPLARGGSHGGDLLRCLGNGASAAAHFAGDVAALTSLAAATPAIDVAPVQARATAEVAVRAALVEGVNGGCAECGGFVARPTVQWPITWKRIVLAPGSVWDGTIGTTPFIARYSAATGWTANLDAC